MTFLSRFTRFTGAALFALVTATTLAPVSVAQAAPTVRLVGQVTTVVLSTDLVGALTALGVQPSAIGYSALVKGNAYFPISSGAIDAANAKGEILHFGGLRLTAGTTRVELSDFIIDTTGTPKLTGLVTANGNVVGRVPLFNLALPQLTLPLTPTARRLVVPGVGVTLTAEAATALNGALNVTAFQPGFNIGIARVSALVRGNPFPRPHP